MEYTQYLQHKGFFEFDGWEYRSSWTKSIRRGKYNDHTLLVIRVNRHVLDDFTVSFTFFSGKKPDDLGYVLDIGSVNPCFVSCLNRIKQDLISSKRIPEETKEFTSAEIDRIIDSYILFKIHEA